MSQNHPRSTSLICADAMRTDVNNLLEALGRGPGNMSIPLWPVADDPENDPPTHWGAHTFDDELASIITSDTLPSPLYLDDYSLTQQEAQAALESIAIYSVPFDHETDNAVVNFTVLLDSLSLKRNV